MIIVIIVVITLEGDLGAGWLLAWLFPGNSSNTSSSRPSSMFTLMMMMMMILTMTMMMTTMLANPQRLCQVDRSLLVAEKGQEVNNNINTKIINIANINLIVLIIKLVLKSSPWQRILFFFIFVAVVGSKVLPPLLPRNKSNDARAIKLRRWTKKSHVGQAPMPVMSRWWWWG